MKFVKIAPGTFMMGSPTGEVGRSDDETQHSVTLTKGFFMGTTLVTRGQFAAFALATGYRTTAEKEGWAFGWTANKAEKVNGASWRNPGFNQTDDHPVVEVTWDDAVAFCQWLSQKESERCRLPTEAEWEYACRAGTKTAYPWGNNPDEGSGWANVSDLAMSRELDFNGEWPDFKFDDGYVFTSPVGKFKANAWGLYDMIGNTWEWCSDCFGDYPSGDATDPIGPSLEGAKDFSFVNYSGPARIARGGSWYGNPRTCRCAARLIVPPVMREDYFGFRVVLDSE